MAEETETQEQEEKPYVRMKREDIQALELKAAEAAKVEILQRELAMNKAGIKTDSMLGRMFFKSYEGELTKEAMLLAAQEVGLVEKITEAPAISDEEKGSTEERQTLSSGATPPSTENPVHPKDEAVANAKAVIEKGGKYEHAAGAFVSTLVKRHAEGDKRATRSTNDRFDRR